MQLLNSNPPKSLSLLPASREYEVILRDVNILNGRSEKILFANI